MGGGGAGLKDILTDQTLASERALKKNTTWFRQSVPTASRTSTVTVFINLHITWSHGICVCVNAKLRLSFFLSRSLSLRESLGCYEPSDDSTFHRSADGPPVVRLLKDFPSRRDRRLFPAVEGLTTDRRGRIKCKSDTFTSHKSQALPPPTPTPPPYSQVSAASISATPPVGRPRYTSI